MLTQKLRNLCTKVTFHCLHLIATDTSAKMNYPTIFHSVTSILEILNDKKNSGSEGVKELLRIYENAKVQSKQASNVGDGKKHPLIVLEGLDGSGKSTLGKTLAKRINGEKLGTPPKSIGEIRDLFDDDKLLRTAYYSLGNYIAALELSLILKEKPVVLDRYWHSTTAYTLGQAAFDFPESCKLPPANNKVYFWPEDLLKPDIVLFLAVDENVRLERHSRRLYYTTQEKLLKNNTDFRQNVIKAYENMQNPGVQVVNGNPSFGQVLQTLEENVKRFL